MRISLKKGLLAIVSVAFITSCGSSDDEQVTDESFDLAGSAEQLVGEATKQQLEKADAPKQALTRVKINEKGEVTGKPETVFMQNKQEITSQNVEQVFKTHQKSQLSATSANSYTSQGQCQNSYAGQQSSWQSRSFSNFSNCSTQSYQKPISIQRQGHQNNIGGQSRVGYRQSSVSRNQTNVVINNSSYSDVSGCGSSYGVGSYNISGSSCNNIGNYVRPTYFFNNPSFSNTGYGLGSPSRNFLGSNRGNFRTPVRNFLSALVGGNRGYNRPYLANRFNNFCAIGNNRGGNYAYYNSY